MASFFTRALQVSWGTASGNGNIFGGNTGEDNLLDSDSPAGCDWNPMPGNLTLERLSIRSTAAAGANFTYQPFLGIPSAPEGPSVVLLSGQQQVEGAVTVVVAAPTVAADLATTAFGWNGTSPSSSIDARTVWQYSLAAPYASYNIMGGGFSSGNFFSLEATRFLSLNGPRNAATETTVQAAMPCAGAFRYLLCAAQIQTPTNDSTYTASLRVNGASVISATLTNAATPALGRETATTASVNAGDLVCFSVTTDGTVDNAHRARIYMAVGFLPTP